MGILILLLVVLAIILAIVVFKALKNTFKAFSLVFFTSLFVVVILIFFFIQDIQVLQESFSNNQSIYLLDDNGTFTAGFALKGVNFSTFAPLDETALEDYFHEESNRIRIVVKRSSLDTGLKKNVTGAYYLEQSIDSPDYQVRSAAFLVGVGALIRQDSITGIAKLVRNGNIAIFPESFVVKVLTFDSKEYKSLLKEQYVEQKDSVYETLGVRQKSEVNASELSK